MTQRRWGCGSSWVLKCCCSAACSWPSSSIARSITGAFEEGSNDLNITLGTLNTAVLLTSSLTMALAVRAAQLFQHRRTVQYLVITIVLGIAFLAIKGVEWHADWNKGMVPWQKDVSSQTLQPGHAQWWVLYFMMTGTHAVHMVVGASVLVVIALLVMRGHFRKNSNVIEMAGLYWHFVDIVWVFLFPTLYLVQRYAMK